jgi:integrase
MALLIECPICKYRQGLSPGESKENPCKKCGTSLSKLRTKTYWIEFYSDGRRKRERIGSNRDLAETVLKKRIVERQEGKLLDKVKKSNFRFSDLTKQYREWSKVNNKSYKINKKYYIDKIDDHFSSMLLREITPWHVEKFKSDRLKITGKYEVNRELATLKHMLTMAVEWGKIQVNPARTVKKLKESKGRARFLMPDEFQKLYEQLPSPLNAVARVAVLSGLRKDNILSLKWSFIDFQNRLLSIPETKNSDPLKIPMNQPLIDLLNSISRHPDSPYVFYKPDGSRYQNIDFDGFKAALKRAGIEEGFHFHDFRHTAASHLVMSGVDLATVAALLGHKDISMTMRYSHLAPDHKRKAIENLGRVFSMDTYMDTKAKTEEKKVIAFER